MIYKGNPLLNLVYELLYLVEGNDQLKHLLKYLVVLSSYLLKIVEY